MTKDELIQKLQECVRNGDIEAAHGDADKALIDYIGDPEIAAAYEAIERWYA